MIANTERLTHLIEIEYAGEDEWERLKPDHTLSEDKDRWQIRLPIVPRVGDVLLFTGWHLRVTNVALSVYSTSQANEQNTRLPEAYIAVRVVGDDGNEPLVDFTNTPSPTNG